MTAVIIDFYFDARSGIRHVAASSLHLKLASPLLCVSGRSTAYLKVYPTPFWSLHGTVGL